MTHRCGGSGCGEESFRRSSASPIRLPMLHHQGCADRALVPSVLGAPDLDDNPEGPAHRTDERRRFRMTARNASRNESCVTPIRYLWSDSGVRACGRRESPHEFRLMSCL